MTFCARVCAMVPHVPGAFLCACRWVVGHASLWRTLSARWWRACVWRTLSARWWRACVWSGVGADTRRHASFAFRGGACCFALWGGDACTFALRGGAGACIFALRSGGACCFALWGGGACSFTFRGSAGCFSFRCVNYGLRMRAARRKNLSHRVCGRGRFDGTGLRCSIRSRWRPSIWFYLRAWRRPCVWGCTVSIGVWHTLPTRRNISFRYVRVSAHIIIPRSGPTTVRVFCSQVATVFSAPRKAVVLLLPLQVVAVGLRATLLKRQAVDLGLWRRQAVLHLRRRLGGIAETSQRTMELGGRFTAAAFCGRADVRLPGIGTLVHGGWLHPVSQQ